MYYYGSREEGRFLLCELATSHEILHMKHEILHLSHGKIWPTERLEKMYSNCTEGVMKK